MVDEDNPQLNAQLISSLLCYRFRDTDFLFLSWKGVLHIQSSESRSLLASLHPGVSFFEDTKRHFSRDMKSIAGALPSINLIGRVKRENKNNCCFVPVAAFRNYFLERLKKTTLDPIDFTPIFSFLASPTQPFPTCHQGNSNSSAPSPSANFPLSTSDPTFSTASPTSIFREQSFRQPHTAPQSQHQTLHWSQPPSQQQSQNKQPSSSLMDFRIGRILLLKRLKLILSRPNRIVSIHFHPLQRTHRFPVAPISPITKHTTSRLQRYAY